MSLYCDGVFDLFHVGHVRFLDRVAKLARERGLLLLVGVISDADCASYKRRPILSLDERTEMVESCKYVGQVLPGSPLFLSSEFLDEHNIQCVVHGDDSAQNDFFAECHRRDIMKYIPYTTGISTTNLIERITQRARGPLRVLEPTVHCASVIPYVSTNALMCADTLNPLGAPAEGLGAIRHRLKAQDALAKYPSAGSKRLTEQLKSWAQLSQAPDSYDLVVGAGASDLIVRIVEWIYRRTTIRHYALAHAEMYVEYARELRKRQFIETDAESIDPIVYALVSPNNPTGLWTRDFREVIGRLAPGSILLVDESMLPFLDAHDWCTSGSLAPAVLKYAHERNVTVMQVISLTKIFACPGLRIGYALLPELIAQEIEAMAAPWVCGHLEETFLTAMDNVTPFLLESQAFIKRANCRCRKFIEERFPSARIEPQGDKLDLLPFLWLQFPSQEEAYTAAESLLNDCGCVVRDGSAGYERPDCLRVNVKVAINLPECA